jgi:hypothetical protein
MPVMEDPLSWLQAAQTYKRLEQEGKKMLRRRHWCVSDAGFGDKGSFARRVGEYRSCWVRERTAVLCGIGMRSLWTVTGWAGEGQVSEMLIPTQCFGAAA